MLRSLAVLGLAVAVVGFVLFAALGVGAWVAKREADRRVAEIATRANAAVDAAGQGVGLLREVIARSEADLHLARATHPATGTPPADPFTRMFVNRAVQNLPGGLHQARDVVGTAADAVRVADAALAVFAERPGEAATLGVHDSELDAARQQLRQASSGLGEAGRLIGDADPTTLSAVEEALTRAKVVADRLDAALARARQGVENARRLTGVWSLRAAVSATVLAVLGAAGQVFMARACWRALRRHRAGNAEQPG
jgi:hypothetical protein